ncbi:superoxide dismutase [Aspergillus pseudocaelatus]|uniref:Superoxide dismutase [Cu-Zn] n=1 Tax=Aspergillus pseudocaelatus TaxID=1825620 RepID=A0ABQ6WAW4_9EURO|nr:superoxide dismutase [Aspergillus pseudocaelatus]
MRFPIFYILPAVLARSSHLLRATAELEGSVQGTLVLEQSKDGILMIEGQLSNIPLGAHGIHIHEFGKTGNGCLDAGGHYNPTNQDHGAPDDEVRHVGDFGNIDVTSDPYLLSLTDHVAKLDGPYSVMDRSIVIHAGKDDLGRGGNESSKTNGNSGARLACAVIKAA